MVDEISTAQIEKPRIFWFYNLLIQSVFPKLIHMEPYQIAQTGKRAYEAATSVLFAQLHMATRRGRKIITITTSGRTSLSRHCCR